MFHQIQIKMKNIQHKWKYKIDCSQITLEYVKIISLWLVTTLIATQTHTLLIG